MLFPAARILLAAVLLPATGLFLSEARAEDVPRWGVGPRLRYVFLPAATVEMFVAHATPMSSFGYGLEAVHRNGDHDFTIGLEYEGISPEDGWYLGNDGDPALDTDWVRFDDLALAGIDLGFVQHVRMDERVHWRFGIGGGLAVVPGSIYTTESICPPGTSAGDLDGKGEDFCDTSADPDGEEKADEKPPLIPVIQMLTGVRFLATDDIAIQLDTGFHGVFFFAGLGGAYLF